MGKNLQKLYSFRTDDEIIKKIEYIASTNTRNRNQQIEHLLKDCINNYEIKNGQLIVGEDGSVTLAKPKDTRLGKSSTSKTG